MTDSSQQPKSDHAHHGATLGTYLVVFGALLVLTGVTVAVAYADLGAWGAPVAMLIASIKATLVIAYFMHVRYESRLIVAYAVSGFVLLAIMLVVTVGEVVAREKQPADPLGPPPSVASEAPQLDAPPPTADGEAPQADDK